MFVDGGLDPAQNAQLQALLESECEKLAGACKNDPTNYKNLAGWGELLLELAMLKKGDEATKCLALSVEKLSASLNLFPDSPETMTALGSALNLIAFREREKKKAMALFAQSTELFKNALRLDPGNGKYQQLLDAMQKAPELYDHLSAQMGVYRDTEEAADGSKAAAVKDDKWVEILGWGVFVVGVAALYFYASKKLQAQSQ